MMRPLALPVIVALVVFSPRLSAQVTAAAEANRRTIEFQTSQVTESDVTVSPDGDWLVFSILGHLYRLPVEGGTAEQLTFGPHFDADPVFSPDGNRLAFVSDRDGSEANIFVFDLATREITQVSQERWAARPAWSPDGQMLAYLSVLREAMEGDWPSPIPARVRWVSLDGGDLQTLDGPPRQFRSTFFLPDGRLGWSVVEQESESGRRSSQIEILGPDGTVSVLRTIDGLVDRIVPASSGRGLYCHRVQEVYAEYLAVTQPAHLTFVPLPDGEARAIVPVTETSRFYWFGRPRFAVNARGTVYLADAGRLWEVLSSNGARRTVAFNAPVRMQIRETVSPLAFSPPTFEGSRPPRVVLDPVLSPDGKTRVFEATGDLWMQRGDGGPARQLLEGPGFEWLASFSPDGRRVAFVQELLGERSLKVFDIETGEVETLQSDRYYSYPAWSPDGRSVVYRARYGVEAVSITEPQPEKLTDTLVARPHFSADGRYLYGTADDAVVYRFTLEGTGQPEPITRLTGSVTEALVSPDGQWLVFGRDHGIWVARLGATPVQETDVRQVSPVGEGDFSLSGDGTSVVYADGNRIWQQRLAGGAPEELPVRLTLRNAVAPPLVIQGVRVLDFESGTFGAETDVLIENGRIQRVGTLGQRELPDGAVTVDAAGRFAVPGLFDMHVHAGAELHALVAYGVTSVRDVGGGARWLSALADRSEATNRPVPRLFYSGEILAGQCAKTPSQARQCVSRLRQDGSRFIKVYSTLPWPLRAAAVEEARLQGLPVVAHGTNIGEIVRGVNAGYLSLEHTSVSSRFFDDVHSLLAAAGTHWTPTLAIRGGNALLIRGEPERLMDSKFRAFFIERRIRWAQSTSSVRSVPDKVLNGLLTELLAGVGAAHERGVKLLAGTDVPVCPECFIGASLHWELELLVRAGLTSLEVLRIATLDAAAVVGAEHDLGSLEAGKLADIVLLDANPLEDIKNTQSIWRVIKGGSVFDPDELRPNRN
jgi:imidazolonepropionase-like amidohydrolase/Tol biopolymer transport system component